MTRDHRHAHRAEAHVVHLMPVHPYAAGLRAGTRQGQRFSKDTYPIGSGCSGRDVAHNSTVGIAQTRHPNHSTRSTQSDVRFRKTEPQRCFQEILVGRVVTKDLSKMVIVFFRLRQFGLGIRGVDFTHVANYTRSKQNPARSSQNLSGRMRLRLRLQCPLRPKRRSGHRPCCIRLFSYQGL
jgi:hypothetical protein